MRGPTPIRNGRLPATAAGLTLLLALAGFALLPHSLAVEPPLGEPSNARTSETLAAPAAPPATELDLQPPNAGDAGLR